MPIYEYECDACKATFETLVSSASCKEKITCPTCGSENVRKVMSAGSLRVGSGGAFPTAPPAGGGCGRGGFS